MSLIGYWLKELWRLTLILAASLLAGGIFGLHGASLAAGVLVFLGWHLLKLHRFARWLIYGYEPEAGFSENIWSELYYQVHKLRERGRKRERKLKNLVERYRESAEAFPDAALVLRRDNAIEWMNEAASSLLGLSLTHDIGQRVDNLVRQPAFVEYLQSGDYAEPLVLSSPVDSVSTMQIYIVPYGDNQRLLIARDITKLHRLEVMRRDFIANVSHELSTPLTVISGYLESLVGKQRKPEQMEQALRQMQQQTERMRNLVNDLLQISRLEMNEIQENEMDVNVPAMLQGLLADAKMLGGERRHEIVLEADESVWLHGVNQYLYSAFANLVRNAVQYTPSGGRIAIRWGADAAGAYFSVADNGIGIPPHLIPRLTERFYRVDTGRSRSVGGTGLGLSIVKHVLRNHQATLEVQSTPGEGSTFSCRFPPARVVVRTGGPEMRLVK
ncbi:MAG: phosphate regulon sensor histidine kinase PhoR [Gammaproteobacteria bacterium]|nr:phosphate regulon sensor histidine kinase PhoR [Gammaproteobacteria bacterium]